MMLGIWWLRLQTHKFGLWLEVSVCLLLGPKQYFDLQGQITFLSTVSMHLSGNQYHRFLWKSSVKVLLSVVLQMRKLCQESSTYCTCSLRQLFILKVGNRNGFLIVVPHCGLKWHLSPKVTGTVVNRNLCAAVHVYFFLNRCWSHFVQLC